MELSGLIFVALALVWAVVLLPKALRQHDEAARTRSVEGVSADARVLARREVVSKREARLVVTTAPKVAEAAPEVPEHAQGRLAALGRAAAAAAKRRRRILGGLLVVTVAVGVAAALGRLPVWSPAIPFTVVVAFLVLARVTVRRERARRSAEVLRLRRLMNPSSTAEPSLPAVEPSAPAAVSGAAVDSESVIESGAATAAEVPAAHDSKGLAVVSGLEDTSSFPVGLLDDVEPTTDAGSLWDPLPVTLPTYVSKPRANRSVRTIDLQAPGVASSGHDAASSALVADAATSAPPDDLPQRAVGS